MIWWTILTCARKCHLDPRSHLAATDMGRKLGGGCAPLGEGELGAHLTQCGQGLGLPACQVSSWSVQPFGHSARTLQTGQDRQRSDTKNWSRDLVHAHLGVIKGYDMAYHYTKFEDSSFIYSRDMKKGPECKHGVTTVNQGYRQSHRLIQCISPFIETCTIFEI